MNQPPISRKRIVVLGGGISGLAAAERLVQLDPDCEVTLLEASDRLGGVIDTVRRDGFLIERSADNFITDPPWALDFCRHLGFADQLQPTRSEERGAMVVRRGRLAKVPEGFVLMAPRKLWPLVTTPLLSPWGKLRLFGELFVSPRSDESDESLASFARRRLGREVYERIVQPLVGGIYTADPEQLSLAATLPRFIEMERRHGSLIRAAFLGGAANGSRAAADDSESGARYGLFVTPREGLASLVAAIAARLPRDCVRLNARASTIERTLGGEWRVHYSTRDRQSTDLTADAVIVALPADRAATVLSGFDARLAAELSEIPYATSVVVSLGLRRQDIAHPLDGFGFVVPLGERRQILAASFSSVKYTGRAPDGSVLVRVFIGGACQAELVDLDDATLVDIALAELRALVGLSGEPQVVDVARWPRSMPQYHLGHCARVESIERRVAAVPTLALAGNAYHGVGIPNCIASGQQAAERVAAALASAPAR